MRLILVSVLLAHLCAALVYLPNSSDPRPAALTYSTLRYRMLDGSFRRPYRVLSGDELLGKLRHVSRTRAREEARPVQVPYYSGLGKGR